MTILQALVAEFNAFKSETLRARALFYLKTGILNGDARPALQANLDHWVGRLEQAGGDGFRRAVLRALGEGVGQ
jgi:hypothetical protein